MKNKLPGESKNWIKLKGTQGWKNIQEEIIWKKDGLHGDHWNVMNQKGKKVKEVDLMAGKFDQVDQNISTRKLKNFYMNMKLTNPYAHYQNTEEWVIVERLLNSLIENQDIELKTAPEYVIGYLVQELRNKDRLLIEEGKQKDKPNGRKRFHL